ncbi:low molecular weight protein-tyrosine-phosphatase [Marinobacter sp. TBZ242]|uniref:protein-tyrosine-phosphatase n=1 Tax=Marinobacter azerbaijanicus TaxID=3050455 RepID=A0ABT7I800_9GAMM|nr:low molecular weight protein-tyrosine-phosphatase [Marinobacter sp. TBZ242]MDL0429823.1 low molecular weight protein-tyrosine-phosphatase [Marinobacter sp. TBZ242]
MTEPVKVLFVCLGNICRSPSAEGVFRKVVHQAGLDDRIMIDSCGTGDWHVGKSPDSRAIAAARQRGVDIADLRARQFRSEDLDEYDYVLVMDRQNLADVREVWRQNGGTEPVLFLRFGNSGYDEVPDPYYGGNHGFEHVLDLITEASEGLLHHIQERSA